MNVPNDITSQQICKEETKLCTLYNINLILFPQIFVFIVPFSHENVDNVADLCSDYVVYIWF